MDRTGLSSPSSLEWHLFNSASPQGWRAGCTALVLPGSLLLTINFLITSLPQAGSWAERKDESRYSLTQYLDVPRTPQASAFLAAVVRHCITLMQALQKFILAFLLSSFLSVASGWYKRYYSPPNLTHIPLLNVWDCLMSVWFIAWLPPSPGSSFVAT